jgi:hypothetical protein
MALYCFSTYSTLANPVALNPRLKTPVEKLLNIMLMFVSSPAFRSFMKMGISL